MLVVIFLLFVLYIVIGSLLGGFYYYLAYKEDECYDLEDMGYLPIWIAALWVVVAPLAFAIYYAKRKVESEDEKQ